MLGVAKDADPKAIKDAFRDLALKYHPDRNKEPVPRSDSRKLPRPMPFCRTRRSAPTTMPAALPAWPASAGRTCSAASILRIFLAGLNFDFGGGSPFESFFHRRQAGPARGANIEVEVFVPLERVASGGEEKVRLTRPATCPACHGTGEKGGAAPPKCEACAGTGRITHSRRDDKEHVLIQQITTCPACHGRGSTLVHPCPQCQGRGEVEQEESLTVKIPVGVEEGLALRIPGKGMPSPEPGGVAGDLFAVVRTQPDPRFERMGADLLRQKTISLTDAVLGTTLDCANAGRVLPACGAARHPARCGFAPETTRPARLWRGPAWRSVLAHQGASARAAERARSATCMKNCVHWGPN